MGMCEGVWKYRVMGKYGGMEVLGANIGVSDSGKYGGYGSIECKYRSE